MDNVQQEEVQNQPVTQEQPVEKTFRQDELDQIVKTRMEHARQQGYELAKRELESSQLAEQQSVVNPQAHELAQPIEDEKIRKLILQEAQRMSDQAVANKIVTEFVGKLETGKQKYNDIEDSVRKLDLAGNNHDIVPWLNGLENTADVIHALAKSPEKYANVLMLAAKSPALVPEALFKLSNSIKQNQEAQNAPIPNEPLGQIKPSTAGLDSGTNYSVRDWRKKSWLKG
jgi:hypothetical protein